MENLIKRRLIRGDLMKKLNLGGSLILGALSLFLMTNTNNNPEPFINRILIPIRVSRATFYYGGLVPLIMLFYSLYGIMVYFGNSENRRTLKKTALLTLIIIFLSIPITDALTKTYKSFAPDLYSIYTNRDDNKYTFYSQEDGRVRGIVTISLENLSRQSREFYIELELLDYFAGYFAENKVVAEYPNGEKMKVTMKGREKKTVQATFYLELKEPYQDWNGSGSFPGNFYIFNENQKVAFKNGY